MKNLHRIVLCVVSLLTVFFSCGCTKKPAQDIMAFPEQVTWLSGDLAVSEYASSTSFSDSGLELLDLCQDGQKYILLARDDSATYELQMDWNLQEIERKKTAVPGARTVLLTENGAFSYAVNENGTYDVFQDGELCLALSGRDDGGCQMLYFDGRLYVCADERLFCNGREVSTGTVLGTWGDPDEKVIPVGIVQWNGEPVAVLHDMLGSESNGFLYCPVDAKENRLKLQGSLHSSFAGTKFCSQGDCIYFADGKGGIETIRKSDTPGINVEEQAYMDLTEEMLPWSGLRRLVVRSDGSVLLLFSDRLVLVTPAG